MIAMGLDGVPTRDRAQNILGATTQRVLANRLASGQAMTAPLLATRLGRIGSAGTDAASLTTSKRMPEITSTPTRSLRSSY